MNGYRDSRPLATWWRVAAIGVVLWSSACASGPGPTGPGPIDPPPVTTPPVIQSVTVTVQRVEVDTPVIITAQVEDSDTSPQSLRYEWTSTAGTFEGTGQVVTWRAAKGSVDTPTDVVVTLSVFEPYQVLENGAIVNREYRVSQSATPFRLHDSVAEISKMAVTFLVDYFGNSSVSPDECVRDFSDSCRGKRSELEQIVDNRDEIIIYSASATVQSVLPNSDLTRANIRASCHWVDALLVTPNQRRDVVGTCLLTAVYENGRWWLCDSTFSGKTTLLSEAQIQQWFASGTLRGESISVAGGVMRELRAR